MELSPVHKKKAGPLLTLPRNDMNIIFRVFFVCFLAWISCLKTRVNSDHTLNLMTNAERFSASLDNSSAAVCTSSLLVLTSTERSFT